MASALLFDVLFDLMIKWRFLCGIVRKGKGLGEFLCFWDFTVIVHFVVEMRNEVIALLVLDQCKTRNVYV